VPKQPIEERVISDYLLGATSEAETERLDEMSLSDDDFAWRLRAVENDLVDAYVRGELSGDALAKFNSHYLASPGRREKVRFAETFLAFAVKPAAERAEDAHETVPARTAAGRTVSRKAFRLSLFRVPRLTPQWGFAAAVFFILLAGGYLMWANLRLRAQMAHSQAERAAVEERAQELQRQLAQQRSSDAETEKELSRVRDRLAQLEEQFAAGQRGAERRDLNIIAFNLAPQTRGAGQIPALGVPAGTDYVALTLALEADDFPAYQAALRNPATGQIVWRSGWLRTIGQNETVRVSLRASLFNPRNYVLEVYGIPATGAADLVSSYPFRIVRQ
jgi:hypothetical protein